jgi:hypothetical protein
MLPTIRTIRTFWRASSANIPFDFNSSNSNESEFHLSSARTKENLISHLPAPTKHMEQPKPKQPTRRWYACSVWLRGPGRYSGVVGRAARTRSTEHTEQERGERRARSAVSRQDFIRIPSAGGGRGEGVALDCPGVTWPRPAPPSKVPQRGPWKAEEKSRPTPYSPSRFQTKASSTKTNLDKHAPSIKPQLRESFSHRHRYFSARSMLLHTCRQLMLLSKQIFQTRESRHSDRIPTLFHQGWGTLHLMEQLAPAAIWMGPMSQNRLAKLNQKM